MSTKIRRKTSDKKQIRFKKKARIRGNLEGTPERPRFCVFRSNRSLYAQIVDDTSGNTVVAISAIEPDYKGKVKNTIEGAKTLGAALAKRALAKNISQVVFDRSGYLYHGRIKAFADGAREAGLQF